MTARDKSCLDGSPEQLDLMRRVAVGMFAGGGLTCLSGVWMTQSTAASRLGQGIVAGALLLNGLVLIVVPNRRRTLQASVLVGIALLSALVAVSNPLGMAPLFYLWPVVYVAYFDSTRMIAGAYGWMVVTLAAGVLLNPHLQLKLDTWTGASATVGPHGRSGVQ